MPHCSKGVFKEDVAILRYCSDGFESKSEDDQLGPSSKECIVKIESTALMKIDRQSIEIGQ
jgi:hypothetical protein